MTTNRIDAHVAWDVCETPLGPFLLEATGNGLSRINFPGRGGPHAWDRRDPVALDPAIAALEAYFAGERTTFDDLTLDLSPSPRRARPCGRALRDIPYGETVSYGELARTVGRPDIVRGVRRRSDRTRPGRDPVPPRDRRRRLAHGLRGGLPRKRPCSTSSGASATGLPPEPGLGLPATRPDLSP